MKIVELRLTETDARDRGRVYGRALGHEVRHTLGLYDEAYRTLGVPEAAADEVAEAAIEAARVWAPEQLRELEGLADAIDTSLPRLMRLTARTEVLAHAPRPALECSTIVSLHDDRRPMTMQTWDWHGELAPLGVLLEARVDGRVIRTFTELGMIGKIGVTQGLGVHFNILHHASDRSAHGVPVHLVMRRILDEANSLDDAIALARSAPVSASTVLTVVESAHGDRPATAASLELSPAGVAVVEQVDGYLAHTNHFLDPELARGEATLDTSTTLPRLQHAVAQRDAVHEARDAAALAAAMCGAEGAEAPVCVQVRPEADFADRWETLLTVSLDLDAGAIDWFAGPPSGANERTLSRFG